MTKYFEHVDRAMQVTFDSANMFGADELGHDLVRVSYPRVDVAGFQWIDVKLQIELVVILLEKSIIPYAESLDLGEFLSS